MSAARERLFERGMVAFRRMTDSVTEKTVDAVLKRAANDYEVLIELLREPDALQPVLEAHRTAALFAAPALAQQRFFLSGNHRLAESARPLDALRRGEVGAVVEAARAFGQQGAA